MELQPYNWKKFHDKCINTLPKPRFIAHYSLNIGHSTKMAVFKINLRQIYNVVTVNHLHISKEGGTTTI